MEQVRRGEHRGVYATPDGDGPWPGLLVLHEALGLNADTRRITTELAAKGYAALAPDLFSGPGAKPLCIARTVRDGLVKPANTGTTDVIEAWRVWLAERPEVDGERIGIIGFCMGGGFAVVAAARSPFAAAAVNYGRVPTDTSLLEGSCPVVASYGADDLLIPDGTPERLEAALTAQGVPVDVEVYPGVGHSFLNHEPAAARLLRIGFDGPTAEQAWRRIDRFFDEHLRR